MAKLFQCRRGHIIKLRMNNSTLLIKPTFSRAENNSTVLLRLLVLLALFALLNDDVDVCHGGTEVRKRLRKEMSAQ